MKLKKIQPAELDQFVWRVHPEANFLQTSSWGKVYELDGEKVFYWGIFKNEELVGTCLAILKPAKRGRYLEIPGGPLLDWSKKDLFLDFIDLIRHEAKKNECVFVRMRPNVEDSDALRDLFAEAGLKISPMHLHAEHTVMIDLSLDLGDLMKNMRRQTRYEVKRASKMNIKVSHASSLEAFNDFYDLQLETAERQGFIPSKREFILNQWRAFGDKARIYTASLNDQVLASGLILLQEPEAVYHEAASSLEGRKYPGAYALQWEVMKDAKKLGIRRYNLFGIAPPNSSKHRYAGVTTFKTGFGGSTITYLPAHDLIINKPRYEIARILELARKRRRHL